MANSPQAALNQLQRVLAQTGPFNAGSSVQQPQLAALQQAFDALRNALKAAYPAGGPNGPVG
jgi:hypothetical protein